MSGSVVVATDLTKTFGPHRGIEAVDLAVAEGETFGFLGPNGAGKSTTIRCLLGLYRPTRGTARTLGADPAHSDAAFLHDVGYLPGELQLPGQLTGADLLARFGRLRGLADTAYRDKLVERLGAETDRRISALSKGNKQKLGLVLALMHRPRLLVLDEPTSGLDPLVQEEFAALVRETTAEGRTVFLSSHDLDEVQRLVDRVAIVREGRIIADDTVEAMRARAPKTIEATFDEEVSFDGLARVPGVTITASGRRTVTLTHLDPVGPVLRALADLQPRSITARPADLEELFHRLYRSDAEESHRD